MLAACKDQGPDHPINTGTMTATVDGVAWTALSFDNTLSRGEVSGVPSKRLDIRADGNDGTTIMLAFGNLRDIDDDCIIPGSYPVDPDSNHCESGLCEASIGTFMPNLTTFWLTSIDDSVSAMTVTVCDASINEISGTFDFWVYAADTPKHHIIGTFTDVTYPEID